MAKKEPTLKELEDAEKKGAESYEKNLSYFSRKPQTPKEQALSSSLDECNKEYKDSYQNVLSCNCGALKKDNPEKANESISCKQTKKIKERSK